jgi:hypothetical protein
MLRAVQMLAVPSAELPDVAVDESERMRLTDDEREAVEWFSEVRKPLTRLTQSHNREKYKDTLCRLLERLK